MTPNKAKNRHHPTNVHYYDFDDVPDKNIQYNMLFGTQIFDHNKNISQKNNNSNNSNNSNNNSNNNKYNDDSLKQDDFWDIPEDYPEHVFVPNKLLKKNEDWNAQQTMATIKKALDTNNNIQEKRTLKGNINDRDMKNIAYQRTKTLKAKISANNNNNGNNNNNNNSSNNNNNINNNNNYNDYNTRSIVNVKQLPHPQPPRAIKKQPQQVKPQPKEYQNSRYASSPMYVHSSFQQTFAFNTLHLLLTFCIFLTLCSMQEKHTWR
jgi:hypothetical protein